MILGVDFERECLILILLILIVSIIKVEHYVPKEDPCSRRFY
jgi:hypothetical protein